MYIEPCQHINFVQILTLVLQVIARIFYEVNRSWSGKITVSELRRSRYVIIAFSFFVSQDTLKVMSVTILTELLLANVTDVTLMIDDTH